MSTDPFVQKRMFQQQIQFTHTNIAWLLQSIPMCHQAFGHSHFTLKSTIGIVAAPNGRWHHQLVYIERVTAHRVFACSHLPNKLGLTGGDPVKAERSSNYALMEQGVVTLHPAHFGGATRL